MPRYLTIGDLQIALDGSCAFTPTSGNTLEAVLVRVEAWVDRNPNHGLLPEAKRWLEEAELKLQKLRREQRSRQEIDKAENALCARLTRKYIEQGIPEGWALWRAKREAREVVVETEEEFREDKERR
jgi:hypothetical protein